jgi:hypothetical protein
MRMPHRAGRIDSTDLVPQRRRRGRPNQWGLDPDLVKTWFYEIVSEYPYKLTLRSVFYRLVAIRDFPNVLGSYKWLLRWSKHWRETDPQLIERFQDFTRKPRILTPGISEIEVWSEKTLPPLEDIFESFRVPVLITRGYGSISMFRDALHRAERRGVKTIAYFGDIGPTGLDIERVTRKKMLIRVKKIALTWNQVKRYNLIPHFCKPKDRRFPAYFARYGNRMFDLESLDPKILREIAEIELRKLIPPRYLRKIELERRAEEVVAEFIKPLREWASEALKRGLPSAEVKRRLGKAVRRLRG